MTHSKLLSAAVAVGALLASTGASALVVTLNPQADNGLGANGVISGANAAFNTVGFQSNLTSTLVIAGNTGVQTYSETGMIDITSFQDSLSATIASGVFSNYRIKGAFTLTGSGSWSGGMGPGAMFTAAPGTNTLSLNLFAESATAQTIQLGTASLDNSAPTVAFAIAFGGSGVIAGATGSALTSLTAGLTFTPAAGTEGANGFFQAPSPFNIALAVGNAGGNTTNTGYSVSAGGVVTFVTPISGQNSGTANVSFISAVPEPGALALVGIALAGLGLSSRRKPVVAA
jgi:hypothetical protein